MTPAEFHQRVQQMGEHGSITMKRAELERVAWLAADADAHRLMALRVAQFAAGTAAIWTVCAALVVFA